MQETEKLYYENSYTTGFSARVLRFAPVGEAWQVVLDRTAFYPEGGGQPCDTGYLGASRVLDVQESDGIIIHTTDRPLAEGTTVEGAIDWARRFSHMQNHTGEHILSGIIKSELGFENVGFHMGGSCVTVDFNQELTPGDVAMVEELANAAVYADAPVTASFPAPEVLESLVYRSKKFLLGKVRIVSILPYDACACCGTHTGTTGAVGVIKILSAQRYKGGARLQLLCGKEALADYQKKNADVYALSAYLSAKPDKVVDGLRVLLEENKQLQLQADKWKQQLFALKAAQLPDEPVTIVFEEGLTPNDLRHYGTKLGEAGRAVFAFSGADDTGYAYMIGNGGGSLDAKEASRRLNERFHGRGGGNPAMAQGSVFGAQDEIEAFVRGLPNM